MNNKLIRTFVLAKCLEEVGSAWFFAIYGLFLVSIGLNEMQFVGVNIAFMVARTLIDPPTGNLGDRIGHKKIYLVGLLLWAIGIGAYGFSRGFLVCVLAEVVSGIGSAFRSEALESWLKNRVNEKTMQKAQTEADFWGKLVIIPTAILGGIVGGLWGLRWPWFLSGITLLMATLATWYLLRGFEDRFDHDKSSTDLGLLTVSKNAWREPVSRKIFILMAITSGCFMPFNMYWSRIFEASGGVATWMGSVWIGISLLGAMGSKIAGKLKISSKTIALMVASIGVPMFFPQFLTTRLPILVGVFLLHEIGRGGIGPILWGYFNRRVENNVRNTKNSLKSAAGSIGAIVGLLISGWLTRWFELTQIWAISAIVLIATALWVKRWNHD